MMSTREKDEDLESFIQPAIAAAGTTTTTDSSSEKKKKKIKNGHATAKPPPPPSPVRPNLAPPLVSSTPMPSVSLPHHASHEAFSKVLRSWASKKFMTGCVILLPIAITFYLTWCFIHFVDGLFSPVFTHLGINVFGLGFVTSLIFILLVGVFMSSWLGASVLELGEWFIKKMPLMSYIYSASKQISAAISPDGNSHAFKEVAIIRHPRIGEYAFGFITSTVILNKSSGAEEVCCVYVPTNHLYLGDIYLINSKDIMRPNLSVREGIEIVISGGMSIPKVLKILDVQSILSPKVGNYAVPQY